MVICWSYSRYCKNRCLEFKNKKESLKEVQTKQRRSGMSCLLDTMTKFQHLNSGFKAKPLFLWVSFTSMKIPEELYKILLHIYCKRKDHEMQMFNLWLANFLLLWFYTDDHFYEVRWVNVMFRMCLWHKHG